MLIDPMYHSIYYDVDLPKDCTHAMSLRIDRNKYLNLSDGIMEKEIELTRKGEKKPEHYKIIQVSTFHIQNSVDNTFFVVCDVKKIK